MYDYRLHRERKHFLRYCLQAFKKAEKLKCHIKQRIRMPKNDEHVKFKNFERKIK